MKAASGDAEVVGNCADSCADCYADPTLIAAIREFIHT